MTDPALLANATVLIADDHEPNLVLMRRVLASAGINDVHVTVDPRSVVRLFHEIEPDIVLLDLHMPGLDGVGVMDEIRRSTSSDTFVPVIVVTADATRETRDRVLDAGANDFLTKPIDRTEVVLRIRNLLHTRSLHQRLRLHNAALQTEVDTARAEEQRVLAVARAQRARVQDVLDRGGPRIVYQPVVELGTGAIVGYEALSRFDGTPTQPPDAWFREAAEAGLGVDLELAAVRAALHGMAQHSDVFVSLNVSPEAAMSFQFAELLAGCPLDRLVVEVTEHARVEDYDQLAMALGPLRRGGTRLAVDDAGAGFASLTHILRLDPDVIKLDISLVRGIDGDPVKRALASSLITFARDTDARIIAEGIETADECACLIDLGIPWGQGYHLGRPGPLPAAR